MPSEAREKASQQGEARQVLVGIGTMMTRARARIKHGNNRQQHVCREKTYQWVSFMVTQSCFPPSAHKRRASCRNLERNYSDERAQKQLPDLRSCAMAKTQMQQAEYQSGNLYPPYDTEQNTPHLKMTGKVTSAGCSTK